MISGSTGAGAGDGDQVRVRRDIRPLLGQGFGWNRSEQIKQTAGSPLLGISWEMRSTEIRESRFVTDMVRCRVFAVGGVAG